MIPSLSYLLMGYVTLQTDGEQASRLLEFCRLYTIPYEDFDCTDDGVTIRCTAPAARRMISLCREREVPIRILSGGGLPRLLRRGLRRPGLLIGGILGLALYLWAGNRFWDIRVSGNEALSDAAVKESLAQAGLAVGSTIRGFEADVLENQVLLLDDRLAWLSVNRKGTVAYVEVREAAPRLPRSPHPRGTWWPPWVG